MDVNKIKYYITYSKSKKNKENKRGQLTIFIIIAIMIIALLILFFALGENLLPQSGVKQQISENPNGYLNLNLEPIIQEVLENISMQGGYNAPNLSREIEGRRIAYLCYNQNYYYSCINQEPVLIQHLKEEIKTAIEDDIQKNFQDMREELEKQNYDVELGTLNYDIELSPNRVIIDINRDMNLRKGESIISHEKFKIIVSSRFYDLAIVAQEIINQEARLCNFEQQGFALFYPEFTITKFRTGDSDVIYTIKHKTTEEEFKFIVRGCVIPPAF